MPDDRFQRLFEGIPLAVGILDAEYRFVEVNPALHQSLGYHPSELVGRSIDSLMASDEIRRLDVPRNGGLSVNRPNRASDVRFVRKDGATVVANLSVWPIEDEAGPLQIAVAVVETVTPRGHADAALLAVRELAHGMSNALNQAQGFTELTLLRQDLSPQTRQLLELAMQGLSSLTASLHQLQRTARDATRSDPAGPSRRIEPAG